MTTTDSLLARVVEHPEDVASRLVLADEWVEAGDLRGELIQVQHAIATAKGPKYGQLASREEMLLKIVRRRVLGPKLVASSAELSFALGFVDEVMLDTSDAHAVSVLKTVCASESGAVLRSVVLRAATDEPLDDLLKEIVNARLTLPKSLRRLELCSDDEDSGNYWETDEGREEHLGNVFKAFPGLEELRVELTKTPSLKPLVSETLKTFEWVGPFISPEHLGPLGRSNLPALERFALATGQRILLNASNEPDGVDVVDARGLRPVLTLLADAKNLRELALHNFAANVESLFAHVVSERFFPQLALLDVTGATIDAGAAVVLARAKPSGLRVVATEFHPEAREALAAANIQIVVATKTGRPARVAIAPVRYDPVDE